MEEIVGEHQKIRQSQRTQRSSRDQACGLPEVQKFQHVLAPEYTLKVHPQEIRGTMMFQRPTYPNINVLLVYCHDQYFDAITSITGFLGYSYYCEK